MIITDVAWTPLVNWLKITCVCGEKFVHRADRWTVCCPRCGRSENLGVTRRRFLDRQGFKNKLR